MKTLILSLAAIFLFGGVLTINAQTTEQKISLRLNKQTKAARGNLTIKFLSVEDSRCPQGVECIWAGNAKVQIEVTNRRGGSQTFDLNTDRGQKSVNFEGWEIILDRVNPYPKSGGKTKPNNYTAILTVKRLTR